MDAVSGWNSPFEVEPSAVAVVHGTVVAPPMCSDDQPVGSEPGALVSKFSANSVVATGVPVGRDRTVDAVPWSDVIWSDNSIVVPGEKPRAKSRRNGAPLVIVAPGPAAAYAIVPTVTLTPGVAVVIVAATPVRFCRDRGFVTVLVSGI